MKLRLPHRLQAALVAALASVSFTTLSSGTLSAAFFFGSQAFAEEAANQSGATIDIGDTNLDAQAAIDEEEGKGEAKEPGSTPTGHVGFNGTRGSSDDFDRQSTAEAATESSIDTENVGTADQANYTGTSADLPSNDLGFTSNSYEAGSDTSNGSIVDSPVTSFTQAPQIASAGGYSAAGTGSGSNSASPVSVFGNIGSGAGGGSMGGGYYPAFAAAPTFGAGSGTGDQTLHVYILTGQSNSLGAVKSVPLSQSKLDAYFTEGAMLWNANLHKGGDYYVPAAQQAWQDVEPQVPSIASDGPSNLCMGPEYGFTHMLTRLAEDNRAPQVDADHLAIIKFSLDGGGNGYWVKGGSGSSYANMLDAAKRALVAAKDKGFTTISLDGLMYLQGESDNGTEAAQSATRYQAFITNLSTDLETWMQQENITGITVSFDSNSVLGEPMLGNDTRKTVNNNFINLAGGNADKNGYGYVYTDDLGHIGDKLHFTGEAQLTIGARYAYAFAVQNNYDVGAVRGANKSAALDAAGAWWMEAMPQSTDVVKWDVSSCSAVNTISSSLTVGGILVEDPYNNAVAITGGVLNIGTAGIELQKGSLSVSSAVNVASSQSWRSQNGYAINTTGNVTIASDATLTIQDGAVVNFHSIGGAGNLTLGTGSGLVSLGMSAQDFAAATPVGEAHYTEGDNGFFNGSRSIITVSGNLVIADGTTLGGMDGLTGAIFSVSDDHHSLYAAATSQTDYFVRSGKITYAAGTNAYAATGLILVDKGSGDACLSLETSLKDNVSIQVSGTGNAIEIAEGVRLNKASLSPAANSAVTLKGDGTYIASAKSDGSADFGIGVTLGGSADWHGILMLSGTNLSATADLNSIAFSNASSWVGLSGVTNVDANWNDGTITSNIYLEDTAAGAPAWKYNNGSSGGKNRKTLTFSGKIAGNGTLLKTGSGNSGIYNQNYTFTGDVSGWTGLLRYEMSASDSANSVVTFSGKATTINASVDYTFTDAKVLQLALGSISDGSTGYTFNNAVKVHQLSATGQNITLGSHAKEDGTVTNGSLEISGTATAGTLTLGSGTTATFGGTTSLAGVNGTGGTLVVGGGNLNVSGSVGGTVAINLQSGSVGNISIASGSNVTLSQAGGTYGTVSVAADTTLTLGSALNVADMTFGSGAKLDATVDFMRSVTYSGTSTGYRDNSDTENGYQQYSDASFTLVTKSAGSAGTVQGAGLLESWTLVSTEDSVVAHGGTVKAGKYYVNTSVDYDAASSTSTAYTGASELVLNSANATLNLLSNLNANACSGGITTAGGATAIASTINIGSGVTLNADRLTRKGSDTVTLAGSGTFAVAGINSTGKKFNAYDALPAGVSKGASWFGCLSLNGNIEQLWLNQAPSGSTVRLDGVTGFMGGSSSDNEQIVAEVEIGAGGYTFTTANTGTRNFKGGFSGTGNLVHANQGYNNSPNLVFSSNMENFTGSIINQKASAGFTLNFNTGASVVNAASIKNDGTAASMLITMNVNDATTFNTLIDKGQGNINLTVASGKSATFNGNTSVSSLSASGADVALGSGASLVVSGATTVDNLSLAGGNTVAFGNGLTYDTLSAQGVSSMSLSGAVSMGEYLMLGKGTLSVNNVQLDLSRDAWDAALDREGSQYSDGESAVNGYATGMKLILARASRIDGAGYAAASGGSLAGMNLSIEVYGAEEDPECSVGGYAQHLVAMGADTSHTYFVNTEAEYDSSSATSGASTRLVMNRANASLSLASNLNSSVCVGGIVVEAQGTSVIVKSGVDLSAGDIHYGDTLTSICVEDQGTLALVGFGGSAIALDRLTLEDGSALDLAALTTFAPAQQPVLLQGMGGGSGMMKVNSKAIGDFSGISLLGDAAPGSPQTVVLATAANGIELGSNVDLKNLVIPEQYQAKLSTQAAEGGGYNLVLTLGAAANDLIWDAGNGTWDVNKTAHWHTAETPAASIVFNQGDNITFESGTATATLGDNITAGNMTLNSGAVITVATDSYNLTVSDLDSNGGSLTKTGSGTATFGGSDNEGITLSTLAISGGTVVFNEHVTVTSDTRVNVTDGSVEFMNGLDYTGGNGHALVVYDGGHRAILHGTSDFHGKSIGIGKTGTLTIAKDATVTAGAVENSSNFENNGALILEDGAVLTQSGVFKTTSLTLGKGAAVNMNGGVVTYQIRDISGAGDINITSQNGGRTYNLTGDLSQWTGTLTQTETSGNMNLNISGTNALNANIVNDATGAACNITVNLTHDMAVNGSINYTSAGPVHVNVGDSSHAVAVNFTNSVKAGSVKVQGASTATFAGGTGDLGSISLTSNNNGSAATTLRFSPNEETGTGSYTASTIDMSSSGNAGLKWVVVDENATLQLTGTSLGSGGGASISNSWGVSGGGLEVNGTLTTAGTISMDSGGNQSTIKGSGQINTAGLNISNSNTTTIQGGVKVNITSDTGIYKRANSSTLNLADATLQAKEASWELKSNMGTVNLTNAATGTTFQADDGYTITVSKAMGGEGKLVKTGDGTLTLSGSNTYSGGTEVNGGTLVVSHASGLGSGAVTLNSGILDLTTTVTTGTLSLDGGTLKLAGAGLLTASALELDGNTALDLFRVTGATGTESITLASTTNGITGDLSGVTLTNWTDPTGYTSALQIQGNNLVLTFTPLSNDLIWDGTNGAMWDTGNNWHTAGQAAGATAFRTDANVQFTADYTATATLGNDVTAGNMVVDSGATATVNTAGHSLTATSLTGAEGAQGGNLVKQGDGTATFNGDINLSGIEVQGGTVYVTDTDTTRGNVGEIKSTQGAALELVNMEATISGNNTQQLKGDLTIGNGALVTVTNTDNLDYNSTSTVTVGAGGELHFENGRWTVGANNKLVLAGGSITGTGDSSNGALDFMSDNTVNVTDDSTISAPIRLRGSNVTFEVADTKNLTIDGLVNDYGTGSLTKAGDGTLTLSGNNTFTGNVTVNDGTLQLNSDHALGADNVSDTATRTITINQGGTIDLNGKDNGQYAYILNGGSLVNNGSATSADHAQTTKLTLTADSTIGGTNKFYLLASGWGETSVDMGNNVLEKTGSNEIVMWSTNVTNGGTILIRDGSLNIDRHDTGKTLSSLATNIEIAKGGADVLKGNFSLGSGNTISSSVADASMSASVALKGATTLNAGTDDTLAITGVLSNAANSTGSITKTGDGTVTLTGANTYTGGTTINAGTVATSNTSALGLSTVTIADGATLQVNGELNIGGSGANSYGVLDNSAGGTIDLTNGSFLKLHAGSTGRTYNLGNVDVSGSASISEEWFDATVNIANINGGAGDTLALISNHSNTRGTWNIGTATGKAQNFTGTLILNDRDTSGDNKRAVDFKFKDGSMFESASIQLQDGEYKTDRTDVMENNIVLAASEVSFGSVSDLPAQGTHTRPSTWTVKSDSDTETRTLVLDATEGSYTTNAGIGARVNINKTGASSQSFTGDLSAMNGTGTVTATAGTLTLDNSGATAGNLASVAVTGGTLNLDDMNVSGAITLSSGTLDLMSATNVGSLNMTGGTLAMDGTNWLSSSTGNLAFTSGMLDLSGMTVEAGHDYILATTTSGSLTLGADVDFKLSNPSLKDQFTLQKQGKSLVLTFVTTEDLIWSGENGNWSSNHWHTETAPDTPVSFTDGHNVTFESGEAEVTLTQDVTAPTTTLESGAVVKVVSEQGGNYTLNTTLKGAGTFVLAASQMALPSGVSLSSTDWDGVVRISGSQPTNGWDLTTLDQIDSTIEFAGVEGYFKNPDGNTISLSRDVIFSNAGSHNAAIYISNGFSRDGGYEFAGNVSGTGTVEINRDVTQHFTFSGDVSRWDGEIKVTICGSGNDGSWVKFTGSATEVNAAINQTGGGDFRVIADADTTFKDDISVTRMQVTEGHTATLEGDVTLTGSQGITGIGAVNVAQGGTLTFARGVDTISGTLTVSDGATLKLSEMNDAAITTSGTLTLNGGSTLDLSSLTSITGRELTPITLMKGGTITDTYLDDVSLVFAGDVTGGKLSVQNNALVLTFIEPGKTLIWDNNTRNQIWSNAAGDTNWHTPNNLYTHIGFEEYDMVQFTGTGATSVRLGENVTPARMDVASGKTLTVYTEGNDLTILQDLDARGASVVLNSDNKEEQATRIMGNTTLKNLTLVDGTASLGGHTEVSEKLTVKNDAEVTVSGTMATKALDISGGSSVSLAAGGTALTTKVAGGSTLTVGANSSLGQLTLNSGTVTNNATLTLSNTQDTIVSGTSRITGTGTTITTGIQLADNSTLAIDGGQTVSITTKNGIIGGSGNGSELTLGNVTMTGTASWSVADTVDSVNLTSTTGSGTIFDTNAHSVTVNAGMSGEGSLTKTGHGTLTLNGSNSFSGDTTVSAGTLKVNNADGLTSSANVNVADGATLWFNSSDTAHLSGTTVIANGGMLHLGSENALRTTGTLTLNDTSVLNLSGLEIKQNQLEYVLASGKSITLVSGFDMDDVIVEYGTHPETGSTPSIIVRPNTETGFEELVLTYDVIDSNSLYWNGGTADWTGSGTWHDVTTKDSTTFAEFDDVFFAPTEYSDPSAASVQANVTQNTNVHDMHIVAREGEGADKNTVNVVVNSGKTLTVDFLEADDNTEFIKTGAGTASVGIKDPLFGADVSVTDGILTTQFLDLAGNGMVVDGVLNRTGGTLNLEVGRAETPTNVEFKKSVSGVKNFTVNEGSNATFSGQVTVPNGQDIYMDVASDASVTFAHDVSLASNNWIIQGDGTINFDGRVDISEQSGNFNQLNGNVNVNFNSVLSTTTAQIDIRLDPGTNLYIKELDLLNSDQDTLYFTFKNTSSTQVDRDSVQIDKMVVDGSRGIGSNTSKFDGLKDYQAGGDINIKQLVNAEGDTSNDIARLCHYAGNLNGVTPGGWGIAQVFNIGEATQEGAAFEGIIRLQDSRKQENWAGTADAHKKTVLVLNDEYVASEAVIELKNYSNFSDFAIGINTANAKVTAIEDYDGHAMQSGNYAKVFSGAMDTANTAVPQSDDTLRTLELIGKKDDTADTVHSTSAGVDRNLNIVKDGAGTQVFSGDSSNFDGSVNAKDGLLKFLNTASLTVQDLTLAANGSATDGTLAVRSDAAGSNVGTAEVHGTLKANSGSKLASNLTLATDSVLDVRSTLTEHEGEYADKTDYVGGLDMLGNSLTLQSGAYLSDADRSTLLSMEWGERYELAYGLSSLTLGDYTTTKSFGYEQGSENNIEASQYFQNLQEDDYYLCYSGSGVGPDGTNVGVFYIFKAPEPTTGTLSLLALAALAARRRRK